MSSSSKLRNSSDFLGVQDTTRQETQDSDVIRTEDSGASAVKLEPPTQVADTVRLPADDLGRSELTILHCGRSIADNNLNSGVDEKSNDHEMAEISASSDSDDRMSDIQVISHKRTHASNEFDDDMSGIRILKQEKFIAECSKSARSNDTMESRPTKCQKRA